MENSELVKFATDLITILRNGGSVKFLYNPRHIAIDIYVMRNAESFGSEGYIIDEMPINSAAESLRMGMMACHSRAIRGSE